MTADPDRLRARGRLTRGALLSAAERLMAGRAVGEVSVAQIATAAGVFPNQVTYYFGSKEALYVEVAFRALLHEAVSLEEVGRRASTPEQFTLELSRAAGAMTSAPPVAEAMLIVRRRPELSTIVEYGFNMLFRQSARFLDQTLTSRGWTCSRPLDLEVRSFWCAVLGSALLAAAGPACTSGSVTDVLTVRAADG